MFGTYRLLLSLLVVVSHVEMHLPVLPDFFNVGVWAVINFYILSGYVMTAMIRSYYEPAGTQTLYFYADRALRIFPIYLFFMTVTGILHRCFDFPGLTASRADVLFSSKNIFLNALIIPLNFPLKDFHAFIPQAWSLGAEEQFYLLFPWVLSIPSVACGTFVVSLCVFVLANVDRIPPVLYGYRLLPGMMFIFLLGPWLWHRRRRFFQTALHRWWPIGVFSGGLVLFLVFLYQHGLAFTDGTHKTEVLLGVIGGLFLVGWLSGVKRRAWDERLGNLAYGVFLSHFIAIWLAQKWVSPVRDSTIAVAFVFAGTLVLAWVGLATIERGIALFRHKVRDRAVGRMKTRKVNDQNRLTSGEDGGSSPLLRGEPQAGV